MRGKGSRCEREGTDVEWERKGAAEEGRQRDGDQWLFPK